MPILYAQPIVHPVPSSKSLTDSNPAAAATGEALQENTDPLHDKDRPMTELRSRQNDNEDLVDEIEESPDPDTDEEGYVQSMEYDPIDQDNTTFHPT